MRTGAAAGHVGYYHEAILFDSDEHLLAVVLPFLLGGIEAGEPAVVGLGERNAELVRQALPAGSGVTFLPGGDVYARPTAAIRSYRKLLASYVADGAHADPDRRRAAAGPRSARPGTGGPATSRP